MISLGCEYYEENAFQARGDTMGVNEAENAKFEVEIERQSAGCFLFKCSSPPPGFGCMVGKILV